MASSQGECSYRRSQGSQSQRRAFERSQVYRDKLDELKSLRDNESVNPDACIRKMEALISDLGNMSELEELPSSAEICLDLQVTNVTGKVIKEHCLATANIRQTFDEAEFIETLTNRFVINESLDLCAIGLIGRKMLKPVPGHLSLMGHLSVEAKELPHKERKPREARKKDAVVEAKAPKKLTQAPQKTEEGVDEIVVRVHKLLRKEHRDNNYNPVSYFNFVLHPTNFAKTVQNMFHISFLIKDGIAKMDVCSEGYPTITPMPRENKEVSSLPKKQMISSLSVKEWRELVRIFDVTRPVL